MSKFKKSYNWFKRQHIIVKVLLTAITAITVFGTLLFLISLLVVSLWNWLMPEIFGLPAITQLQAMGLLLLVSIFKGVVSNSSNNNNHTVNVKKESCHEKDDFDEMYEKWWNEKGEASFNDYMEDRE